MPRLTCVNIDYSPPREPGTQMDSLDHTESFNIYGNEGHALIENSNPEIVEKILTLRLVREVHALELITIRSLNPAIIKKLRLLPELRELTLSFSSIDYKQLRRLLNSVRQLERLHLDDCVEIKPGHYAHLRKRFPSVELILLTHDDVTM